jgi:hypothetical protein
MIGDHRNQCVQGEERQENGDTGETAVFFKKQGLETGDSK